RGLDGDAAIAVADLDRAADAQGAPPLALPEHAGRADQVHEGRGAAVHDGQLGAVDLDAGVVDAEPEERREQVLDGADAGLTAPERGREAGRRDLARARGNLDGRLAVGPDEGDAFVRS